LIARVYEVFWLICPLCGGQMRSIASVAFITVIAFLAFLVFNLFSADIHKISTFSTDIYKAFDHIGVDPVALCITPALGPPLWDGEGAQKPGGVEALLDRALANQLPPGDAEDQRTAWFISSKGLWVATHGEFVLCSVRGSANIEWKISPLQIKHLRLEQIYRGWRRLRRGRAVFFGSPGRGLR